MRWEEEVELLCEEMRRSVVFMRWLSQRWTNFSQVITGHDTALTDGLRSYAARQAALCNALAEQQNYLWRLKETWIVQPDSVPDDKEDRWWFEKIIQPKKAPLNLFTDR